MTIGERIKELRGDESVVSFCKRFDIHKNTLPRYEGGKTTPDGKFLSALCKEYEVHADWLLLGNSPKYLKDTNNRPTTHLDYDYIPMIEAQLSAGGGAFVEAEGVRGYYAFRKDWLSRVTTSAKDLVLMRVTGDSMSPTLMKNDTVLIDTGKKVVKEGEIYAIRYDNTIMVKRLTFRPGPKLVVMSDNKVDFESYEVKPEDLHIIGQVIFFSRALIPEGI